MTPTATRSNLFVGLNLPKNQNLSLKTLNLAKLMNPLKSKYFRLLDACLGSLYNKIEIQGLRQNFDSLNLVGLKKHLLVTAQPLRFLDHIKKI
jgi:hypothetical protein